MSDVFSGASEADFVCGGDPPRDTSDWSGRMAGATRWQYGAPQTANANFSRKAIA